MKSVRLQKIYPCVFCDQSEVFGKVDENGTWRDGIFTALVRKSIKVQYYNYIVLYYIVYNYRLHKLLYGYVLMVHC